MVQRKARRQRETPIAYKNADQIKAQIREFDLATIVAEIKPLGCIMAGGNKRRDEAELTPKQIPQIGYRAERRRVKRDLANHDPTRRRGS